MEDEDASDEEDAAVKVPQHAHASETDGDSSSDDNDSAAAAHAAAIGHSPQPIVSKSSSKDVEGAPEEEKEANGAEESATPRSKPDATNDAMVEDKPSSSMDNTEQKDLPIDDAMENENTESVNSQKKQKETRTYCPYNLNERDTDENTPIHIAIHARKLEHVKALVTAGASVHKKSDGSPPIHAAISIGSLDKHSQFALDCVVFLHENDADLSSKDDAMHTPLYLACMYRLPQIVSYILSTDAGASTLNLRSDRSQGRALHAAAKFDIANPKARTTAVAPGHPRIPQLHHHPDGTVSDAHQIPGFSKGAPTVGKQAPTPPPLPNGQALITQMLLKIPGIEVDATNSVGQTPLHVACSRGNWTVVRLLLQAGANPDLADRRGFSPGQCAHKRGMLIPNDLIETLGGPPSSGTVAPPRDLIVDPDSTTLLLTHELCGLHRTCAPIRRDPNSDPPPENVRRLSVLVNTETGILRTTEFDRCRWENETRRAAIVDVLKVRQQFTLHFQLFENTF